MMKRIYKFVANNRITRCILLLAVTMFCSAGCSYKNNAIPESSFQVYLLSQEEDCLVSETIILDEEQCVDNNHILDALVSELRVPSDDAAYHPILSDDTGFVSASIIDNQVVVDFDSRIYTQNPIKNVLIRAAITRTFTQIVGVNAVTCTVDESAMLGPDMAAIGSMTVDDFIENAGAQINPEERTTLTLYFANDTGDALVPINRSVVYSGNISMDKLVVEQLLVGPMEGEKASPVLNPQTRIINVTTQDGTCYVNLDSHFLNPEYNITNDVAIYSIVDSLIEMETVNKVQFLVNSDSDALFRESVSLNTQFDRNLDLIEQ